MGCPKGRKAQNSCGGQQVGAPSRLTVAGRPVEMGEKKRVQREIEAVPRDERWRVIGNRS